MSQSANDHLPFWFRIKSAILAKITNLEWSPGAQVPTEKALETLFGQVSRGTVRRALLELELEGYIRREQGKGTFVSDQASRMPYRLGAMSSFSQQVRAATLQPRNRILAKGIVMGDEAGAEVRRVFEVNGDAAVVLIKRLRFAGQTPLSIQTVFLADSRCPGILGHLRGKPNCSLVDLYKREYGVGLTQALETLRIAPATQEQSKLLGIPLGAPVTLRHRVSYADDAPFELLDSEDAAAHFEYQYQISRDETTLTGNGSSSRADQGHDRHTRP